jgi:SAM-dependent methyltransferase
MKINNWKYNLKNIDRLPKHIFDSKESVLANSVNAINYELLKEVKKNKKILEIGCGSYSWIKENLQDKSNWTGLDIKKYNDEIKNIATDIGSVHNMIYDNNTFDYILSNQSIEHWSEYGVKIEEGLLEIARCLKKNGVVYINFPLFLHGHPYFIKGNIDIIKKKFELFFNIHTITAYYSKKQNNYTGWIRCGFPDWYIPSHASTSFVVNVILKKKKIKFLKKAKIKINLNRKNIFLLHLRHGFIYFLWKIINYLRKNFKL